MKRLLVPHTLCALLFGCGIALAAETPLLDSRHFREASVYWGGVGAPIGRIVLIRKGAKTCAIKFTQAWRGNDSDQGTPFRSGDETHRTAYESVNGELADGKWSIDVSSISKGEVGQGRLVGVGRLAFGTRSMTINCATFQIAWLPPTTVHFFSNKQRPADYGVEIALTKWSEFREVDPHAGFLRWFRYDAARKKSTISIEDLW